MNKIERCLILLIVLVISGIFLAPTIRWYACTAPADKALATGGIAVIREYAVSGSTRDVGELKEMAGSSEPVDSEKYAFAIDAAAQKRKEKGKSIPKKWTADDILSSFKNEQDMFSSIEGQYRKYCMDLKSLSQKALKLGLDLKGGMSILVEADVESFSEKLGHEAGALEISEALTQDIDILKTRVDQFGVSEPDIRIQGNNRILIEIPGEADPERADSFLKGKGSLYFSIVDRRLTSELQRYAEKNFTSMFDGEGNLFQPDFIPEGKVAAGMYESDDYGIDVLTGFVVLDKTASMDGAYIRTVEVGKNSINAQPVVNFHLDGEGGEKFYELTSGHKGEALAVVMDGKVKSVATINDAIHSDVQVSGFTQKDAEALALTLRTASLPIELSVVSQQSVGASLGDDAVEIGLKAVLVGLAMVVLFMFCYYGLGGLIADLSLILDFVMMLACLSAFRFTLTLTSIAGLILTLGMAVDSNVIIYERMKEELALGKSAGAAIKAGYSKAFWTIVDANVTTIIAALVLSALGSSAVKGFANTLAVGIVCSVFCSLFVSHLIYDLFVTDRESAVLHLGFGGRKHGN